jgi:hypothetical protein
VGVERGEGGVEKKSEEWLFNIAIILLGVVTDRPADQALLLRKQISPLIKQQNKKNYFILVCFHLNNNVFICV